MCILFMSKQISNISYTNFNKSTSGEWKKLSQARNDFNWIFGRNIVLISFLFFFSFRLPPCTLEYSTVVACALISRPSTACLINGGPCKNVVVFVFSRSGELYNILFIIIYVPTVMIYIMTTDAAGCHVARRNQLFLTVRSGSYIIFMIILSYIIMKKKKKLQWTNSKINEKTLTSDPWNAVQHNPIIYFRDVNSVNFTIKNKLCLFYYR